MYGALRLVSVEQGYDPRDFALMAFGGAGPLHANAVGKLTNAWPVIIPPGPGVLCAYGDATTRCATMRRVPSCAASVKTSVKEVAKIFRDLAKQASKTLDNEGIPKSDQTASYQVDIRYHGQGLLLTVDFEIEEFDARGLDVIGERFDEMHRQLFTFALPHDKELVNLRAVAQGQATNVRAPKVAKGGESPSAAATAKLRIFVEGKDAGRHALRPFEAAVRKCRQRTRDRSRDGFDDPYSPGHQGRVDDWGNILITPAT
jgi:N-methylhydantoinase A